MSRRVGDGGDRGSVLVVEDEPDLVSLYEGFLEEYDVRSAGTVAAALDDIGPDVDVVLLDRRLPDGTGDDVLAAIRDRGLDCRVAMVTAVEPDFDIVDMGFDLYLTKPVSRDRLRDAVERLHTRAEYDELLRRAAALATKRALLRAEKSQAELERHDAYERLVAALEDIDADLSATTETFTSDDYRVLFRDIGRS